MSTTHVGRIAPLFLFSHPDLPIPTRILLVYSTITDDTGWSSIGIRTLASLIGLLSESDRSDPLKVEKVLRRVRSARYTLLPPAKEKPDGKKSPKRGLLEHRETKRPDGRITHSYRVIHHPVPADALSAWNRLGKKSGIDYQDRTWSGGSAPPPVTVKVRPAEYVDMDDLFADEPGDPDDLFVDKVEETLDNLFDDEDED